MKCIIVFSVLVNYVLISKQANANSVNEDIFKAFNRRKRETLLIEDLTKKKEEDKEGFADNEKILLTYLHNAYRSLVNNPRPVEMNELVWDNDLEAKAQAWANNCTGDHNKGDTSFKVTTTVGENIAIIIGGRYHEAEAVKGWYDEVNMFQYDPLRCNGITDLTPCGHYITLAWEKFQTVGCGIKRCPSLSEVPEAAARKAYLIVCNYAGANFASNTHPYESGVPCTECPGGLSIDDSTAKNNLRCRHNLCVGLEMVQSGDGYNGSLALLNLERDATDVVQATDVGACPGHSCVNGATCVDHEDFYTCSCALGYEGDFCEKDIDWCINNGCQNGALCVDGIEDYSCQCPLGFEGAFCEINIDDCVNNYCENGATCIDGINDYSCQCQKGYEGTFCDMIQEPDCRQGTVYCAKHSTCSNNHHCECEQDYHGVGYISCSPKETDVCTTWADPNIQTFAGIQMHFAIPCRQLLTHFNKQCRNGAVSSSIEVFGKSSFYPDGHLYVDAAEVNIAIIFGQMEILFQVFLNEEEQSYYFQIDGLQKEHFDKTVDNKIQVGEVEASIQFDSRPTEQMFIVSLDDCETVIKFRGYNNDDFLNGILRHQPGIAVITKDPEILHGSTLCMSKSEDLDFLYSELARLEFKYPHYLLLYRFLLNEFPLDQHYGRESQRCYDVQHELSRCSNRRQSLTINKCAQILTTQSMWYAKQNGLNIMELLFECLSGFCRQLRKRISSSNAYLDQIREIN